MSSLATDSDLLETVLTPRKPSLACLSPFQSPTWRFPNSANYASIHKRTERQGSLRRCKECLYSSSCLVLATDHSRGQVHTQCVKNINMLDYSKKIDLQPSGGAFTNFFLDVRIAITIESTGLGRSHMAPCLPLLMSSKRWVVLPHYPAPRLHASGTRPTPAVRCAASVRYLMGGGAPWLLNMVSFCRRKAHFYKIARTIVIHYMMKSMCSE